MKFLIDANLGRRFSNLVNNSGYDAVFINDVLPRASDEEILVLAEREKRVIITNDKDFGMLVFKHGKSSAGVILLRVLAADSEKRFDMVKGVFFKSEGNFIVIKDGQVRRRGLK